MSRSLNKVTLIGNLGADPEVRATSGGNRVATFSLATSRQWSDTAGAKQEKTEWHRCVVWNTKNSQLADIVERYCHKGDKIYVEGRIEYRQWQDKENQTKYTTEINVRELIMLGGGRGGEAPADLRILAFLLDRNLLQLVLRNASEPAHAKQRRGIALAPHETNVLHLDRSQRNLRILLKLATLETEVT